MFTKLFLKDSLERAVKTVAQVLITLWTSDEVLNLLSVDWQQALGVAGGAAVLSFLMSIVSAQTGKTGSASLTVEAKAVK